MLRATSRRVEERYNRHMFFSGRYCSPRLGPCRSGKIRSWTHPNPASGGVIGAAPLGRPPVTAANWVQGASPARLLPSILPSTAVAAISDIASHPPFPTRLVQSENSSGGLGEAARRREYSRFTPLWPFRPPPPPAGSSLPLL